MANERKVYFLTANTGKASATGLFIVSVVIMQGHLCFDYHGFQMLMSDEHL